MADGDHYASYASVQYLLMNAGLGTSGNTMFDANAIEEALDITFGMINMYIHASSKVTDATQAPVLRGIQIDLVHQMIMRARYTKENNLADGAIFKFYEVTPQFTRSHLMLLNMLRDQNRNVAYNYSTHDGSEIT